MSFIISNKQQQEHIKELALPIFAAVEKLLCVINANKDHATYANVQKATLDLNKTIFVFQGSAPSWDLDSINKALRKLIQSVPRMSRNCIPYQELENYLNTLDNLIAHTNTTISFLDKIKQKLGFGKNPR